MPAQIGAAPPKPAGHKIPFMNGTHTNGCPPSFAEARTQRQKARVAGLHSDYWYPVEYDHALRRGRVIEVRFWNTSIALYRSDDGQLFAIENRCAHRQLKLSLGHVDGCNLTCSYHGWTYDGSGKVVAIPHDLFGKSKLKVQLKSYPVQVRHGLIWIFPGDPKLAGERGIPDIPELEGKRPWPSVTIDFTWRAHHSMIFENIIDFTHAYLHRSYRPFEGAKLLRSELAGDRLNLAYEVQVGRGRISGLFVDRQRVDTNSMELGIDYPYQWSNTGGKIKHWCFLLPIDERTSRAFFVFYFEAFQIPFTRLRLPHWLMRTFMGLARYFLIRPLLEQDGWAVEAEQEAFETHYDAPLIEVNPVVGQFQQLAIRKWEEYLDKDGGERRLQIADCRLQI
jgi:phenylpropionate dioxygenase-like ring-hydroxylating dioxygenase large terminal subunit